MSTIINTPATGSNDSGAVGIILVVVLVGIVSVLLYVYGAPNFKATTDAPKVDTTEIKINVPTQTPTPQAATPVAPQ